MVAIDLSKILSKYKKGWLALSPDSKKVVAKGKTLASVLKTSQKKGIKNPTVLKVAPFANYFIG